VHVRGELQDCSVVPQGIGSQVPARLAKTLLAAAAMLARSAPEETFENFGGRAEQHWPKGDRR